MSLALILEIVAFIFALVALVAREYVVPCLIAVAVLLGVSVLLQVV